MTVALALGLCWVALAIAVALVVGPWLAVQDQRRTRVTSTEAGTGRG